MLWFACIIEIGNIKHIDDTEIVIAESRGLLIILRNCVFFNAFMILKKRSISVALSRRNPEGFRCW